jgi:predicted ester cyclase
MKNSPITEITIHVDPVEFTLYIKLRLMDHKNIPSVRFNTDSETVINQPDSVAYPVIAF